MMPGRRPVLVLTSTFPRHAGDTLPPFVLHLCQAMQAEGWESRVLAPHAAGAKTYEELHGIPCHRFRYAPAALEQLAYGGGMLANVRAAPWRWLLFPGYLASLFFYALYFILRYRLQTVHAHWIVPQGLVAAMLKKLLFWRPIRFVMTAHGADLQAEMGGVMGRLLVWSMRQADVLAVVSAAMAERAQALGMPAARIVVASMGVDVQRFCAPAPDHPRQGLVFVGRLAEKKGVTYLLQAFALLCPKYPDVVLTIVGDGPLRAALEAEAEALGISAQVRFVGARPPAEIPGFFQSAQVFAMPSIIDSQGDQEGLGLVAAEAMSCLCPVVAHDLAAIRDLVRPDDTGVLVPAKDVAALAAALSRVLEVPAEAWQRSLRARAHVQANYSWQAVAARYARLYSGGDQSSPDAL